MFEEKKIPEEKIVIQEQKKAEKHLGKIRPIKGLKVFKWLEGIVTEVCEDDYEDHEVAFRKLNGLGFHKKGNQLHSTSEEKLVKTKKLKVDQDELNRGVYYIQALNKKNAVKKLQKLGKYVKPKSML